MIIYLFIFRRCHWMPYRSSRRISCRSDCHHCMPNSQVILFMSNED